MGSPSHDKEKNEAFAAAIEQLYKMYPLPEYKYPKLYWNKSHDREVALRNARSGAPLYMIDCFAVKVPKQELENIHTLIFG